MTDTHIKEAKWNPARVLAALGKIGYSASAAILDIVDNSVSNGASRVDIKIEVAALESDRPGRKKAVMNRVVISDNGSGMNEDGLDNALTLGSSVEAYSKNTLSKFGMGLKSASASLGKRLTVVSRADSDIRAAILDHGIVEKEGRFVYTIRDVENTEREEFELCAGSGSGTMIVIDEMHREGAESPAEVRRDLSERAGITYQYALTGDADNPPIIMTLDGDEITAVDPLFENEASTNGNLDDESNWDGLSVSYIQRRQSFQLDELGAVYAAVTITQLPHPPSVGNDGVLTQAETRKRYGIGAGNYGFYIYRNGRLISWADNLGGKVPQDQDLYAFRGRIEITDAADDVLNIDVSKSRIILSDLAASQLTPIVAEAVKKSRIAWKSAGRKLARKLGQSPHDDINSELNEIEELEAESDKLDEEAAPADEREQLKKRRKSTSDENKASTEESEQLKKNGQRVQYVASLENNQLWQRAHDPDDGSLIVRVNSSHRFVRDVLEQLPNNTPLIKLMDVFFFGLARGEFSLVYKSDLDQKLADKVMSEYREQVGGELSDIIRKLNVSGITNSE